MTMTSACVDEYVNVGLLFQAKQQGLAKDRAMETNRAAAEKYKIDPQAIENVYANPHLKMETLMSYSLWACAARKRGLSSEPIATVAQELDQCVAYKRDKLCWQQLRNVVWKLPRDFVPKSRAGDSSSLDR